MLGFLLLLAVLPQAADRKPVPTDRRPETVRVEPRPCAEGLEVHAASEWERNITFHPTANGVVLPPTQQRELRLVERTLTVTRCRMDVADALRVRYANAVQRRTKPGSQPTGGDEPAKSAEDVQQSPISGKVFEIVQQAEAAQVTTARGDPAPAGIAALVLEAEGIVNGAVPLPGDELARALGGLTLARGDKVDLAADVIRGVIGRDESDDWTGTLVLTAIEKPKDAPQRARFTARFVLKTAPEQGTARTAELTGEYIADPVTGRPSEILLSGTERRAGEATTTGPGTETAVDVQWRVRHVWTWR